ncbi:hypothetical protein GCM10009730_67100 [Streptomyces albidochromogenes]|uniref:hypothetical protein n=1 Tax=Streptomyces albidochromogenes TaxID=329524 RepID=UPI00110F7FA9|nr:hypothetical protein [Streptomyces albidochromogenes]
MTVRTVWTRRVLALAAAVCAGALYAAPTAGAVAPPPPAECAQDDKKCQEEQKQREQEAKREKGEKDADSGREQVDKDSKAAKKDIAKAQDQVDSCPPQSKECMNNLVGAGEEQRQGIEDTQQKLENFRPEPQNNADAAVDDACKGFAATLPPSAAQDESLTDICELMAK